MKELIWQSWTRRSAIRFLRKLEMALAGRYHVALAGSVLLRGLSKNDLDVIVYPASSHYFNRHDVVQALTVLGGYQLADVHRVHDFWRQKGMTDSKHVEIWAFEERRVDVFMFGA